MTGDAMISEFLIAVFAGMVAIATFRRNTPRAVEVVLWVGLIWVCVLAVTSARDQQSRALTGAALWGASQMVGTIAAMAQQSVMQWLFDRRFFIADWVVLLFGVCLLLLTLLMTRREAMGWQPRVRLGEWMEIPRVAQQPQRARVTVSAVDEINQRFKVWAPMATAAALTWLTLLLIWTGDVVIPTTERKLKGAALRAEMTRRRLAAADWRGLIEKAGSEPRRLTEQVVGIEVLARGASAARVKAVDWLAEVGTTPQVSWFRGFGSYPTDVDGGIDLDVTERDRRDRLAS
jgi:arginine exporter protein ArgO